MAAMLLLTVGLVWLPRQWQSEPELQLAALVFKGEPREVTPSVAIVRTQPDPAMPREVQQVVFGLKKGEPTMVETPDGFLVATPVEIIEPDPATDAAQYQQVRTAVARTVADDITAVFSEALRLRANPRINQANVDQIVQP